LGFLSRCARKDEGEPQPIVSRAISATIDYGSDAIFQPAKHGTDFEQPGSGRRRLWPRRRLEPLLSMELQCDGELHERSRFLHRPLSGRPMGDV